jgi:DNA-binding transcriptional regulator YbjK
MRSADSAELDRPAILSGVATLVTGARRTGESGKVRKRAVQNRTLVARGKIAEGAFDVLAQVGVAGLTHRAVAQAADVSLAATTYHFDTKSHIIEEASRTLLDGYVAAFRRMASRIAAGEKRGLGNLDDLVERVALNALGRDRIRSLAWCELILHGGRTSEGRALAQRWYEELDLIWHEIAELIEPGASKRRAGAAIDLVVGLTFVLHPLGLRPSTALDMLAGRTSPEAALRRLARPRSALPVDAGEPQTRYAETRERIVEAAIDLIIKEGAASVSYRRVAEALDMVRSGPSYYFPTIDELIEVAQTTLFDRARARYRAGLGSVDPAGIDEDRLLDLTTAIYYREALEFGSENVGHYSVWIRAAQHPPLRPAVASSILSFHHAWSRRIAVIGGTTGETTALRMQALFIGKLIRTIVGSAAAADLSWAREDFAGALRNRQTVPSS